jgi:predicted phage terminase large subunit-like protein
MNTLATLNAKADYLLNHLNVSCDNELLNLFALRREQPNRQKEIDQLIFVKSVLQNKYVLHGPTPKQTDFLQLWNKEAFYGGACGGGKSDAVLMAALQPVAIPDYSAIIFRRTYKDLALPKALMDRAREWLAVTDARWNGLENQWIFPSGAKLTFGYLATETDKYRYQSSDYQFIAFDELTQFEEDSYRYLFSRLRRLETCDIPLRMRGASNPGNIGHDWVKRRFITEGALYNRIFVPARLDENPYLDRDSYIDSLNELDPITRKQYLEGDWTARHGNNKFNREWFKFAEVAPADAKRVRYWDMAATTPAIGKDPDYSVGLRLASKSGEYWIEDIIRKRVTPNTLEKIIQQTATLDGLKCDIYMEQEPGSEGISLISHYSRNILNGFTFRGNKATGSKELRADPVSSAAEAGNIFIINGTWVSTFLDEAEAFPLGGHDDQVDALS